ncbi:MAG TPA: F0F1 ATP synthase subunit delta [Candidatus Saccharimonadales bacterium]|nr:F0F1 ATP synthase subunit delta [Candidatus Saccharimonadales bacterium]
MKAPRTRIASVVADRSLKGSDKRLSREVAAYLLDERRVNELDSLLRDIQADWAEQGYVEVLAASAHELSSATLSEIKSQVKELYPAAKQIIVTPVHDPSVIGGVRLRLAEQQLDLSVEAKLNRFKQLTSGKD